MYRLQNILFLLFSLATLLVFSQKAEEDLLENYNDYKFVKPGDTLFVQLGEITLLPNPKFKKRDDIRYYNWLRRKVFKSYPYAKVASDYLDSLNYELNKIKSKRKKKKHIRNVQQYLDNEFTEQIKKMTKTEGRILIKLIHRQTGKTVFENIKEYRSGWRAFWYNSTANVFSLSLKYEYLPELVNEDFLIEDILQRAFLDDKLEKKESKLNFDFFKTATKKEFKIDVEEYRKFFAKMKRKHKINKK